MGFGRHRFPSSFLHGGRRPPASSLDDQGNELRPSATQTILCSNAYAFGLRNPLQTSAGRRPASRRTLSSGAPLTCGGKRPGFSTSVCSPAACVLHARSEFDSVAPPPHRQHCEWLPNRFAAITDWSAQPAVWVQKQEQYASGDPSSTLRLNTPEAPKNTPRGREHDRGRRIRPAARLCDRSPILECRHHAKKSISRQTNICTDCCA